MESTVNDFLNEINEIVPLKNNVLKKEEIEWKECFDSKSGFTYYWNINTNEVTWEKPKNFVIKSNVNGPVPNFPELKDKVKIYKISETQSLPKSNGSIPKVEARKVPKKKKLHNDSDDEKITLITSYGSGSSSESEDDDEHSVKTSPKKLDQEEDILSTVLKRAEELKKLGNVDAKKVSEVQPGNTSKPPKPISGFSLVAGYDSNSEQESEDETNQSTPAPNTQAHSTLFPIMKTPDVNDFKTEENIPKKEIQVENSFDMKNFKRKRRLAVNFVPNRNVAKPPSPNTVQTERKGLGFKENEDTVPATTTSKNLYTNFTKGGVEFVKSETENGSQKKDGEEIDEKEMVEIYEVLHEKLAFLCEGNKDVMPVQIILIQIETLYGALKAESLKPEYLHDWLKGTSEDLIKLEREAAPEGWSLQWDRPYTNPINVGVKTIVLQDRVLMQVRQSFSFFFPNSVHKEKLVLNRNAPLCVFICRNGKREAVPNFCDITVRHQYFFFLSLYLITYINTFI
ncbi:formin-binding protein 4-like isoform X2 [Coccinella septempunctata]|uniref:formin-binding protein 4-like isoform X2 n=1 Tax=Coccinella septempunctata TaxID=41139 RepID=UPI001D072802|nr:formin-binding protein 4-like isoform X2 [Coccinella septempunctata]